MLEISKTWHGLKAKEIWFADKSVKDVQTDVLMLKGCPEEFLPSKKGFSVQHTLHTDLTEELAALQEKISKTFRYDIRRNEKDNVVISVYNSSQLAENDELISQFLTCYQNMYKEKGMNASLTKGALIPYINAGNMLLTVGYMEDKPIVFHSYLSDGTTARLWHSCSNFRTDREMVNIIGRTNKRLHWEDIKLLKELGYKVYDWGGVFSVEGTDNGIDAFKKSFGGTPVDYYNGQFGCSCKGKLMLLLARIKNGTKSRKSSNIE